MPDTLCVGNRHQGLHQGIDHQQSDEPCQLPAPMAVQNQRCDKHGAQSQALQDARDANLRQIKRRDEIQQQANGDDHSPAAHCLRQQA